MEQSYWLKQLVVTDEYRKLWTNSLGLPLVRLLLTSSAIATIRFHRQDPSHFSLSITLSIDLSVNFKNEYAGLIYPPEI